MSNTITAQNYTDFKNYLANITGTIETNVYYYGTATEYIMWVTLSGMTVSYTLDFAEEVADKVDFDTNVKPSANLAPPSPDVAGDPNVNMRDGAGTGLTSTPVTGSQALDVNVVQTTVGAAGDASSANQVINHSKLDTIETTLNAVEAQLADHSTNTLQTSGNASLSGIGVDTGNIATSASSIDTKLNSQSTATKQDEAKAILNTIQSNMFPTVFRDSQTSTRVVEIAESFVYPIVFTDRLTPTVATGGTVSVVNQMLTASTSVAAVASAAVTTKSTTTYIPGREMFALFTPKFTVTGTPGTQVGIPSSDQTTGFFTDTFSDGFGLQINNAGRLEAIHRQAGVTVTSALQTAFNGDTLDGSGDVNNPSGFGIDLTKINIFLIKFGYLGTAPAEFWVNGGVAGGGWINFHTMDFPNTLIRPHIGNTNLGMYMKVNKLAGLTDVVMTTTCWSAGYSGDSTDSKVMTNTHYVARSGIILGAAFAESYVLSIQIPALFQGVPNRFKVFLKRFGFIGTNDKEISIRVLRNATLIGLPVYTPHDAVNAVVEFDIAATGRMLATGELVGISDASGKSISSGNLNSLPLMVGDVITFIATTKTAEICG